MQRHFGDVHIVVSNDTILLVIKFRIDGSLRFLSHAQMLRLFQRACVRAGLKIQYSRGFNPRPKLSLPLPRPVGIASDDEVLYLRGSRALSKLQVSDYESKIKGDLSAQLPKECELLSVSVAEAGTSFQPCLATYAFAVQPKYVNEKLNAAIERLLASERLNIQRIIEKGKSKIGNRNTKLKKVDVRAFLESIKLDQNNIIVECKISPAGSIRIEEILNLLELDIEKLVLPIRRTTVQWHKT